MRHFVRRKISGRDQSEGCRRWKAVRDFQAKHDHALSLFQVFLKLIDELNQSHGLDVVFASFSRLVVCTHRNDIADALARADNLSRMLRGKPLFVHLDLQFTRGWHQLLWYDAANYAGIKVRCCFFFLEYC